MDWALARCKEAHFPHTGHSQAITLAQFLTTGSAEVAYPLAASIIASTLWPDSMFCQDTKDA